LVPRERKGGQQLCICVGFSPFAGKMESGSEMAGLRGEKQRKRGTFVPWFSFGQGKGGVAGG